MFPLTKLKGYCERYVQEGNIAVEIHAMRRVCEIYMCLAHDSIEWRAIVSS
jgi:hypothetical protein